MLAQTLKATAPGATAIVSDCERRTVPVEIEDLVKEPLERDDGSKRTKDWE